LPPHSRRLAFDAPRYREAARDHEAHGRQGPIHLLEGIGVLIETSGKRRDRTFAYKAYLDRLRAGTELDER
jgi:hypothetical protein